MKPEDVHDIRLSNGVSTVNRSKFCLLQRQRRCMLPSKENYSEVLVIGCKRSHNQLHQIKNVFSRFENLKCE